MAKKLCKLCHERPAEIPDRETYTGRWRKEVCTRCHAERLHGDLKKVLADMHSHGHCTKVDHNKAGSYLHGEKYDGPYTVDGVDYCGRCHRWIEKGGA